MAAEAWEKFKTFSDQYKGKDGRILGEMMRASGWDRLFSTQDALAAQRFDKGEFAAAREQFGKDRGRLDLSSEDQKKWANLRSTLDKAEAGIQRTFVVGTANLAEPIGKLGLSFEHIVSVIMEKGGPLEHWIDDLAHGVDLLAKQVDSPDFQHKVDGFLQDVGRFAVAIAGAAKSLVKWAEEMGLVSAPSPYGELGNGAQGTVGGMMGLRSRAGLAQHGGGGSGGESLHNVQGAAAGGGGVSPSDAAKPGSPKGFAGVRGLPGSPSGPAATHAAGGGDSSGQGAGLDLGQGGGGGFNVRGVKNMNPGNIAWGKFAQEHGATGAAGRDQDHGVAVFPSYDAGVKAMATLARHKYDGGKTSIDHLIADSNGWTPGNHQAAANIARSMGISPHEDAHLDDPAKMARFRDALMIQELGPAGARYVKERLGGKGGGGNPATPAGAANGVQGLPGSPSGPPAVRRHANDQSDGRQTKITVTKTPGNDPAMQGLGAANTF